jgi:ATP-dependent DNA helicase DinG
MDVRLFTKGYGRTFLKSLPASPVTRDLKDIAAFFQAIDTVARCE